MQYSGRWSMSEGSIEHDTRQNGSHLAFRTSACAESAPLPIGRLLGAGGRRWRAEMLEQLDLNMAGVGR